MENNIFIICAIMKDEQKFLQEWIEYHLSIGFNKILLYEDFTSTSHKEITDKFEQVELHSMSEIKTCHPYKVGRQIAVYDYICETIINGWCLFIDIDEYFRLEKGYSLQQFAEDCKDYRSVLVWWKCYGANEYIQHPAGSLQEAYSPDFLYWWEPYWQFKSFVNLNLVGGETGQQKHFINCHFHKKSMSIHGEKGDYRQHLNKKLKTYDKIWIDHYITKSWEDYVERLKRGNITKGLRDVDYFFKLNPKMKPLQEELTKGLDQSEFPTI